MTLEQAHLTNPLPKTIQIVLGEVDHLPMLADLMDQYRQFYGQPSNRPAAEQFLFERLINHESVIYLALDTESNQAAGFMQLYPTFSSVSLQPVWILNDLFVMPNYRRCGIARALIQQAVELVQTRGDKGLTLETAPDNRSAQALYEAMGFQQDTSSLHYIHWFHQNRL
jgi:ribosomal protein S18 acetylase RimI-like enzyme